MSGAKGWRRTIPPDPSTSGSPAVHFGPGEGTLTKGGEISLSSNGNAVLANRAFLFFAVDNLLLRRCKVVVYYGLVVGESG